MGKTMHYVEYSRLSVLGEAGAPVGPCHEADDLLLRGYKLKGSRIVCEGKGTIPASKPNLGR